MRPRSSDVGDLDDLVGAHAPHETLATARAILAACGQLPVEKRQALLLRDLHGLSYEDIAAVQGVPIGTVRSRISDARRQVASEVER